MLCDSLRRPRRSSDARGGVDQRAISSALTPPGCSSKLPKVFEYAIHESGKEAGDCVRDFTMLFARLCIRVHQFNFVGNLDHMLDRMAGTVGRKALRMTRFAKLR